MIRILLTGGGTGGHIYPLIAVADELQKIAEEKKIDIDIRYLGAPGFLRGALEADGIRVSRILGSKWRRYFDLRNFLDIPKFFISFFQAMWKIFWIMPDILFSKGGPASLSVVLACRFYRIPVFMHESDTIPGFSNRLAARYASWIGLAFESAGEFLKTKGQIAAVGNPIRESLLKKEGSAEDAKRLLGFDSARPLILFMGSSQGAQRINEFVLDALSLMALEFQILHQTGGENFEGVKREAIVILENLPGAERARYKAVSYFGANYADALKAADLIVSRSSSSSVFEIAAFGKPSILIPLPESAGDHQRVNAYEYAKTGATIVMENDNLKPHIFLAQVKNLFQNPEKLRQMSDAALKFAKPEAARVIAETLLGK